MMPSRTRTFLSFAALLSSLSLVGAGCFIKVNPSGANAGSGTDGGVYRTADRGNAWTQKVSVLSTGDKRSIAGVSVTSLVQDPSDASTLYLGTAGNGLLFSNDAGESWQQPKQLVSGQVFGIAVDPRAKCTVYAAIENKLAKTLDCGRTWDIAYLDPRADKKLTQVAVNPTQPSDVWITVSTGDLLVSRDGGVSWAKAHGFGTVPLRLAFHHGDSRTMYVLSKTAGLFRSQDGGVTWSDLAANYPKGTGTKVAFDLAVGDGGDQDLVIVATQFGLLRTRDLGESFEAVPLLTPGPGALPLTVAVDPQNAELMYYGTASTFYRTDNGGANWVPKKNPTTRAITRLLVDRANGNVLYAGTTKL
jgi:photosystem II stability/assembly factor-like uncharacterized protein